MDNYAVSHLINNSTIHILIITLLMRLKTRFILSHILPVLLIVPLIGVALIYLLETQVLLQDLSTDLTEQAAVIAYRGPRPF